MTIRANTRNAGRRLLRSTAAWAVCSAIVRSRRPDRALRRVLPGLGVSATVVPLAAISLWVSEFPLHVLAAEATVAINYSLAPKAHWPAHIIDTKRAIAWIKREIGSYGGDPDFVAMTGGSAGGHLTALAALSPSAPEFQPGFEDADTSVVAAVPFYGVYDLLDRSRDSSPEQEAFLRRIVIGASAEDAYEVWDQGSALSWVNADAPPFFVLHGSIDTFTNPEQARAFVDALRAVSGNPVAHAELTGAQHMFDALHGSNGGRCRRGGPVPDPCAPNRS